MSNEKQSIAVDEHYKIRDNQFWYNDCSFRYLIENKEKIEVKIDGLGTHILKHSAMGIDGRTTLSYKLPSPEVRKLWVNNSGEIVRVELCGVWG